MLVKKYLNSFCLIFLFLCTQAFCFDDAKGDDSAVPEENFQEASPLTIYESDLSAMVGSVHTISGAYIEVSVK